MLMKRWVTFHPPVRGVAECRVRLFWPLLGLSGTCWSGQRSTQSRNIIPAFHGNLIIRELLNLNWTMVFCVRLLVCYVMMMMMMMMKSAGHFQMTEGHCFNGVGTMKNPLFLFRMNFIHFHSHIYVWGEFRMIMDQGQISLGNQC
jgi:hypothetical protein